MAIHPRRSPADVATHADEKPHSPAHRLALRSEERFERLAYASVGTVIPAGRYRFADAMGSLDEASPGTLGFGVVSDGGYALMRRDAVDPTDMTRVTTAGTDVATLCIYPVRDEDPSAHIILEQDAVVADERIGWTFGPYVIANGCEAIEVGWIVPGKRKPVGAAELLVHPGMDGEAKRLATAWLEAHPRPPGGVPSLEWGSRDMWTYKDLLEDYASVYDMVNVVLWGAWS